MHPDERKINVASSLASGVTLSRIFVSFLPIKGVTFSSRLTYRRYLGPFVCNFWGLSRSPSAILLRVLHDFPVFSFLETTFDTIFVYRDFFFFLMHTPISRADSATLLLFFWLRAMLNLSYSYCCLHFHSDFDWPDTTPYGQHYKYVYRQSLPTDQVCQTLYDRVDAP